jgi:hypothetical protein
MREVIVRPTLSVRVCWIIAVAGLAACGAEPFCGVDVDGEDIVSCVYDQPELPLPLEFCPGDSWGSVDGCNSCACDTDGAILCTSVDCPGEG